MTKVQRYKVGFFSDEWEMSSITPCLIPDDSGFAVKFEDYCKLEAENERLKHNLTSTEQTMREYQELAAKRLEEIAKYRDVPVVAWEITFQSPDTPTAVADYLQIDSSATVEQLIVKPGEMK